MSDSDHLRRAVREMMPEMLKVAWDEGFAAGYSEGTGRRAPSLVISRNPYGDELRPEGEGA